MVINRDSTEALLTLLATYYVYDLRWCNEVLSTLLFLESEVLKLESEDADANSALSIFRLVIHAK